MAFIQTKCTKVAWAAELGQTEFYLGDLAFSFPLPPVWQTSIDTPLDYGFTLAKTPIFETGFFEFEAPIEGEYFLAYRRAISPSINVNYQIL